MLSYDLLLVLKKAMPLLVLKRSMNDKGTVEKGKSKCF